jgi:hypothetical protein
MGSALAHGIIVDQSIPQVGSNMQEYEEGSAFVVLELLSTSLLVNFSRHRPGKLKDPRYDDVHSLSITDFRIMISHSD